MNQSTTISKRANKPKSLDKGRFKLAVRFTNNLDKVYYFWSNRNQDNRGISDFRFRQLVLNKPEWVGKVAWAAIYEEGQRIHVFTFSEGWH